MDLKSMDLKSMDLKSMDLKRLNLSPADERFARWSIGIAMFLIAGLSVTGIWQFFFHAPNDDWLASSNAADSLDGSAPGITGINGAHDLLAGLLTLQALFVMVWVSYRVRHRISWPWVAATLTLFALMGVSRRLRFLALLDNDVPNGDSRGYLQFFTGDVDGAVTPYQEVSSGGMAFWVLLHLLVLPVMLAGGWYLWRRFQTAPMQEAGAGARHVQNVLTRRRGTENPEHELPGVGRHEV